MGSPVVTVLYWSAVVLLIACVFTVLVFVVRYLRTEWEVTPEGRHMMAFSAVILTILATTAAGVLGLVEKIGVVGWLVIQNVEFALLLTVLVWRDVLLFRAQRRKAEGHERAGPG